MTVTPYGEDLQFVSIIYLGRFFSMVFQLGYNKEQ